MHLSEVSKTALFTLRSHAEESQKKQPLINDPMSVYCLDKFESLAKEEEKARLFRRRIPSSLTNHIVLRARKYDSIINEYIVKNPGCTVINLGCGFDTRFWRINHKDCRYIELDLPESVEIKGEILKGRIDYELIGCSVLDHSWINKVTERSSRNFLLVAEGLLMYLPEKDVINLFNVLSSNFIHSQLVFEVVAERFTRGIGKKMVEMRIKRALGLDAGISYAFGVKNAKDIESFAKGFSVVGEWSYFEDDDIRPGFLKWFRNFPSISRTQWTIMASLNVNG
jgi:methyltransferase (TIGR00027 family)